MWTNSRHVRTSNGHCDVPACDALLQCRSGQARFIDNFTLASRMRRQDGLSDQPPVRALDGAVAIVVMEVLLISPIDRCGCIVCGAVFDPLTIDIEIDQAIRPIDLSRRPWRDQDLLPGPPVLGIDDEVMDAPIGILHEEVLDMAELAVARMDVVPRHGFDAAQMRV